MMEDKKKFALVIYLFSFLLSFIPALFLTAPQVEDALGTMGAAAYLTGHQWGPFLVEKGFYYKYGISELYLPVFLLARDPVLRYKLLLTINSALMAFIPVMGYRIGEKHLGMMAEDAAAVSLIAGGMPSALLYGKLTWAEPVLFTMPWVVIFVVLELAEGTISGTRRRALSAALALATVFAFMSHQRGIVLIAAVCMLLALVRIVYKVSLVDVVSFGVFLAAGLAIDRLLDSWTKNTVYLGAELKYNTLGHFLKPEVYGKLLSAKGLVFGLRTALGWLFNSAASGFGITLFGMVVCVSLGFGIRDVKGKLDKFKVIVLFGSLLYVGAFLLGMLFFSEDLYDYWAGINVYRCDHLVFGRYLESVLPVMMYIGLVSLGRIGRKDEDLPEKKALGILAGVTAGLMALLTAYFAVKIAPAMEGVDSYIHSLMSMNICFDMSGVTLTQDVISNLPVALVIFGAVSCVIFLICICLVFAPGRKFGIRPVYVILAVMFLYIYMRNMWDVLYRVDTCSLTEYARFYLTH